jgi:hypothetical protein
MESTGGACLARSAKSLMIRLNNCRLQKSNYIYYKIGTKNGFQKMFLRLNTLSLTSGRAFYDLNIFIFCGTQRQPDSFLAL